jgi:hypothetical protein
MNSYEHLKQRLMSEPELYGWAIQQYDHSEHEVAELTTSRHASEIETWYRFQTVLSAGLLGDFEFGADARDLQIQQRRALQLQLIGLSCNTAKSVIDLIVFGSYNVALAGIRNMVESFVHIAYAEINPNYSKSWYRQNEPRVGLDGYLPVSTLVDELKTRPPLDFRRADFSKIFTSWSHLCKGAHPSGEGITTTVRANGRYGIGAVYDQTFILDAFWHGYNAMKLLALALHAIKPQTDEWGARLLAASTRAEKWHRRIQEAGRAESNRRRREKHEATPLK